MARDWSSVGFCRKHLNTLESPQSVLYHRGSLVLIEPLHTVEWKVLSRFFARVKGSLDFRSIPYRQYISA